MGVGYDTIGTTTDSIIKGIVVPLVVGSIVLIIVTTWLGWWRPGSPGGLPDGPPRPPRWLLAVPILVFIAVLLGIDYGNLGNMGGAMIALAGARHGARRIQRGDHLPRPRPRRLPRPATARSRSGSSPRCSSASCTA